MPVSRNSMQRQAVYDELYSRYDHPTAETLFLSLKKVVPNISLATVYRNLKVLESEGVILKIQGKDSDHFDGHCHEHYHFTCNKCGKVLDLEVKEGINFNELPNGFSGEIHSHSLMYYGICENCK